MLFCEEWNKYEDEVCWVPVCCYEHLKDCLNNNPYVVCGEEAEPHFMYLVMMRYGTMPNNELIPFLTTWDIEDLKEWADCQTQDPEEDVFFYCYKIAFGQCMGY